MISIVIPLYNKEQSIAQTLDSVLSQEGADFEVVIVDDGSTDHSYTIAKGYAERDTRIRLYQQENGGPGKARNMGTQKAKGEWIVYLDADDEILSGSLALITQISNQNSSFDIIDLNSCTLNGNTKFFGFHPIEGIVNNPMQQWFFHRIGPGSGHSAFKKAIMLRHPYDERIRRFEDAELLMKVLPQAKVFSCKKTMLLVHTEYASSSHPRKNVMDDYFAYLDFHKGGFWQRMCAYRCFLENRDLYPEYGHRHYKWMYYRYDLLLLFKLLNWWGKHFFK